MLVLLGVRRDVVGVWGGFTALLFMYVAVSLSLVVSK